MSRVTRYCRVVFSTFNRQNNRSTTHNIVPVYFNKRHGLK